MKEQKKRSTSITSYDEVFSQPHSVKGYYKKFKQRIERARHSCEVKRIKKYAYGKLCDCSIGLARFVPHLNKVTKVTGMDISLPFLKEVKRKYPHIETLQQDIHGPYPFADGTFDTVMSIRTLFAVPDAPKALKEMYRICRPGGLLIFDYGVVEKSQVEVQRSTGNVQKLAPLSPESFLQDTLNCTLIDRIPLDMFFHKVRSGKDALKFIKPENTFSRNLNLLLSHYLFCFFNSPQNIIPLRVWCTYEALCWYLPFFSFKGQAARRKGPNKNSKIVCKRFLYIYRK